MKNDLPYFSHDNDARNHAKMKALRARFGWTGYGQFWALNEMIAAAPDARLDLSRKVVKSSAACELGMTPDALDDFLEFLADPDECGLIHIVDNLCITTDRTQDDYSHMKGKREREKAKYYASRKSDNGNGISVVGNAISAIGNDTEQNRIEENRREGEPRARDPFDSCTEDSRLLAYCTTIAKQRGAGNVEQYARRIMREPDIVARFEAEFPPKKVEEPPLPDPGPCPDCGGDRLHYPGDPRDRVRCMRCGKAAVFDFDSWVEEEAPETVDTS